MKAEKDPKVNNSEGERTHFQTKGKFAKDQMSRQFSKPDGHRIVKYGFELCLFLKLTQ